MISGSPAGAADVPLPIGQSFYDGENRIRMTVLGKGNTTPESLDIKVELNVGCTFSLGQISQNYSASGGEEIILTGQNGCRALASMNDDWIYVTSTDAGTIRYVVAANYGNGSRTGTITVNGQTFTVRQSAAVTACAAQPAGVVAWWRGEGNALDQTGSNNGTLTNNMTFGGGRGGGGFLSNAGKLLEAIIYPIIINSLRSRAWRSFFISRSCVPICACHKIKRVGGIVKPNLASHSYILQTRFRQPKYSHSISNEI